MSSKQQSSFNKCICRIWDSLSSWAGAQLEFTSQFMLGDTVYRTGHHYSIICQCAFSHGYYCNYYSFNICFGVDPLFSLVVIFNLNWIKCILCVKRLDVRWHSCFSSFSSFYCFLSFGWSGSHSSQEKKPKADLVLLELNIAFCCWKTLNCIRHYSRV